jgi:hypothetical protein
VLVEIIPVTLNKNGANNVRIIKITASQNAGLLDVPYLFNVKEKTRIKMEATETIIPDRSEKLVLTCLLEPTFSPERFMKTLSITHDGNILWTHDYVLGARSGGTIPLIAAGGVLSAELSQIRQVYHMVDNTTRWSREECESRLRNTTISFPPCDDRSFVTMVEAGEVQYEGLRSISIRRIEPDSRFCDVTFS